MHQLTYHIVLGTFHINTSSSLHLVSKEQKVGNRLTLSETAWDSLIDFLEFHFNSNIQLLFQKWVCFLPTGNNTFSFFSSHNLHSKLTMIFSPTLKEAEIHVLKSMFLKLRAFHHRIGTLSKPPEECYVIRFIDVALNNEN